MASSFKGVSERFKVTLGNSDGHDERVTIQIGLDGLKVLDQGGTRTMKSYDLSHISRWQSTGNSLVLYTKTPVDMEERQLTLTADSNTIRNALDTLTCCCMQLVEILQSGRTQNELEAANNLHALVAGGGKKKSSPALPNADSIEYWKGAEKQGWLQSQAEVMKVWRKRWFVLKQGYLFRFLGSDVSESTKPRAVVDLSKVQDVRDGRAITGKPNSILLKTATGGSVCYITDSETEMVEWISALEGSIAKIVKLLAGVEDEARATTNNSTSSSTKAGSASDWAKQVERNVGGGRAGGGSSSNGRHGSSTMVSVVGYDGGAASAPAASSSYYGSSSGGYGGGGGGSSGIDYSQIAGAGVAGGGGAADDMALNYGGFGGGGSGGGGSATYGNGSSAYGGDNPYGGQGGGGYGATAAYGNGGGGGYGAAAAPMYGNPDRGGYDSGAAGSSGYGGGGYGAPQQQQQQPQHQQQQQPMGGYGAAPAAGGYYQQQQQPQQPQLQLSSAPSLSLLDQVPSQQPAYPYYQPSAPQQQQQQQQQEYVAAPAAAAAAPPPVPQQSGVWQVHYTAEGRAYYFNTATNATQWDAPAGM